MLKLICPRRFQDSRGWFSETWNQARFAAAGIGFDFCQDNHSLSQAKGTLRGLHFQAPPFAQTKLVRCIRGRIFDVAVDIRRGSPTFGRWTGAELSAENGKQLLIPVGYAHGFVTLERDCEIAYKVDTYYSPECDGGIAWDDPAIGIDWPLDEAHPLLSDKDRALPRLEALTIDFPYDGNPLGPLEEILV
ncbi:MAG: dTDP-4-dehydrorhamnose 3,5-epimerase [Brevundimonas sp.]|nr:dTDP-4-dehydrorhamnose 3,5-epimerase [Brevundimonas sp.]